MDRRRDRASVAAASAAKRAETARALADGDRRDAVFAWTRLSLAGATVALAGGGLATGAWPWTLAALPLVGFVVLIVVHARHAAQMARLRRRARYLDDVLARLEDRWHGRGVTAAPIDVRDHPYADDLDLFGHGSLFDLLCTARTDSGQRTLAAWLLTGAAPDAVRARHVAVAEIAQRDAFREDLAVLGPELGGAAATASVATWATASSRPPVVWLPPLLVVMSAATLGGLAWWWRTGAPPPWIATALVAQGVVGFWLRPRVLAAIHDVEATARDLAVAADLLARVEREPFAAPALVALQQRLSASGASAAAEIARLQRLVELLTSRQNQMFGPLSVLLFWATHLAWAVDRWRARVGRHVPGWFDAVGEIEALAALGTFADEHPAAVYPVMAEGPPRVRGRAVTHPLLPLDTAVGNDVDLGGDAPHLLLVSGSNMSGKSTYLRAVGACVVLAQAGAPVCAEALELTPLVPAGTLRIQDSLQAGRSRFFAEITKLRQIVELARRSDGVGTLFLIDEVLAGTNSHDRQQGATGVLGGLVGLGAIGLATTHDLALTSLVEALGARAANAHFADRFDAGGLVFDYQLRPGVVTTSNALALMQSIGLDVHGSAGPIE